MAKETLQHHNQSVFQMDFYTFHIEILRIFIVDFVKPLRLGESYVPRCVTHSSAECWAGASDSEWPFGFASNAPSSWLPTHALETSVMGWLCLDMGNVPRCFIVLIKAQDSPDKPRFSIHPKRAAFVVQSSRISREVCRFESAQTIHAGLCRETNIWFSWIYKLPSYLVGWW